VAAAAAFILFRGLRPAPNVRRSISLQTSLLARSHANPCRLQPFAHTHLIVRQHVDVWPESFRPLLLALSPAGVAKCRGLGRSDSLLTIALMAEVFTYRKLNSL